MENFIVLSFKEVIDFAFDHNYEVVANNLYVYVKKDGKIIFQFVRENPLCYLEYNEQFMKEMKNE